MGRALCCLVLMSVACTKSEPVAESAACCTNDAPTHEQNRQDTTTLATTGAGAQPVSLDRVKVLGTGTRDGIVVSVQNHGDHTVSLRSQLTISRGDGTVGLHVPGQGPVLRWSCDAPAEACVTLAPGAELIPPVWAGRRGQGTCGPCPQCADLEPGSYFLSATSCEQNAEVYGPPFLVSAAP